MQNYTQPNNNQSSAYPQQGYNDPRYGQQAQGYPLYNPQQGYGNNYNANNTNYAGQQNQGYYPPPVQGYHEPSGRYNA